MARTTPKLRIPEEQKPAVRYLAELTDEQAAELQAALESAHPAIAPAALAAQLEGQVDIDREALVAILRTLLSLAATGRHFAIPPDRLASDVSERALEEGLISDEKSADVLRTRLDVLLRLNGAIGVSSRALNVMLENKNTFVRARIITDVRHLFSTGDDPQPVAATIVHTLRIESHTDDRHVNFYFAMDLADVRQLQRVLARAVLKEQALRKALAETGISILESDDSSRDPYA